MKRVLIACLIFVLTLSSGCSKKEEKAHEILNKVSMDNPFMTMEVEVQLDFKMGQIQMLMPVTGEVRMDHLGGSEKDDVYQINMNYQIMNQEENLVMYYKDGTIYIDNGIIKTTSKQNLESLIQLIYSSSDEELTEEDTQDYVVEKTEDGYVLSVVFPEDVLSEFHYLFKEYLEVLSVDSLDVKNYEQKIIISNDYKIKSNEYKMNMVMNYDGQESEADFHAIVNIETHDSPQIEAPDFKNWSTSKVACKFPNDPSNTMLKIDADNEKINTVVMTMDLNYEEYQLTTQTLKDQTAQTLYDLYEGYKKEGLQVEILQNEDALHVVLTVDYPNASVEVCDGLGIPHGYTMSKFMQAAAALECTSIDNE